MNNKKILSLIALILIAVMVLGATYAYFAAQVSDAVTRNVNVLTHTVDTLTFSISNDINIEVNPEDFYQGGANKSSEASVTATLSPNSKTGTATDHYYIYLDITSNELVKVSNNPELLLQVFDTNNNLVSLSYVGNQITVDGLTGYDITGRAGLITLLDNHTINANNYTTANETYRVVLTMLNYENVDQKINTGKSVAASLLVQKDKKINEGLWVNNIKISDYSPEDIMDNLKYELDCQCLNDIVEEIIPTTVIPSEDMPVYTFDATSENSADIIVEFANNINIETGVSIETNAETGDSNVIADVGYLKHNNIEISNQSQFYDGIQIIPDLATQFNNILLQLDTECVKKLIGEPQVTNWDW